MQLERPEQKYILYLFLETAGNYKAALEGYRQLNDEETQFTNIQERMLCCAEELAV